MKNNLDDSSNTLVLDSMSSLDSPVSINSICEQSHLFAFNQSRLPLFYYM